MTAKTRSVMLWCLSGPLAAICLLGTVYSHLRLDPFAYARGLPFGSSSAARH
jgi:hypothetical protein